LAVELLREPIRGQLKTITITLLKARAEIFEKISRFFGRFEVIKKT
jgi:hypothetical protein